MLLKNEETGEIITKPMGTTIKDAIDSYNSAQEDRRLGPADGKEVSAAVPVSAGRLDSDRRDGVNLSALDQVAQ